MNHPKPASPSSNGFGFYPLAIEDALQQTYAPKLDDWGDYLYIVLNYMHLAENGNNLETEIDELDIFLGKNYIITHHDEPVAAIDGTWAACERDMRSLQDGADHLLYKITDYLIADYMPIVEKVDSALDQIEDQIFD